MVRMEGRPENIAERLPKEQRCYELLDQLGIVYQRVDHAVTMTMEACKEVDEVLEAPTCKNLLLCTRNKSQFYLLLLPGDKVFKTSDLSKQIGSSRLSFAEGTYMEEYLDITPGSLSIMGLMNDQQKRVQLILDADVLKNAWFGCHPCINTTTLRMETRDVVDILIPAMGHEPVIVDLA